MDAARLQEISESLFEVGNWRRGLANYLGIDESTVCRWVKKNKVPSTVKIAMELSFLYGVYKEPAGVTHG